jgi:serine phosphatase RsbU (regulator of sigma subunit)
VLLKTAPPPASIQSVQAPELRGAELAAVYYGERTGGDFYDFLRVGPERVVFGLLDVAGRKQENLAVVAAAQQAFRTGAVELLAAEDINEAEAMIELALRLNRAVIEASADVHACPAFAGCYNESSGIVSYFNAGHTPALLRDGGGIVELPATGLPLGLFSHVTSDAKIAALTAGAVLTLVSRGVVEARDRREEMGLAGVKARLQDCRAASAKEFCLDQIDNLRQFMRRPPTHNDVTVMSLLRFGD